MKTVHLNFTEKDIIELPNGKKAIVIPEGQDLYGRKPLKERVIQNIKENNLVIKLTAKELNKQTKRNISKFLHNIGKKLDPEVK
jgi:hypothetical protein